MKVSILCLVFAIACCKTASAHFPWLAKDESGKVVLFFGENLADRTYRMPEPIAKAEWLRLQNGQEPKPITATPIKTEKFVGLSTEQKLGPGEAIAARATFGIYNNARLDYYCLHLGKVPTSRSDYANLKLNHPIKAEIVDSGSGIDVFISWEGKPLVDADVKLSCEEGHNEGEGKTDSEGKIFFKDKQVEDGINGIMVGHKVEQTGEIDGKKYANAAHYLTVTFPQPKR